MLLHSFSFSIILKKTMKYLYYILFVFFCSILAGCTSNVESKAKSYCTEMMNALLDDNVEKVHSIALEADKWGETLSSEDKAKVNQIYDNFGEQIGPKLIAKFGEQHAFELINIVFGLNLPTDDSYDYSFQQQDYVYDGSNVDEYSDEPDYDEYFDYDETSVAVDDEDY